MLDWYNFLKIKCTCFDSQYSESCSLLQGSEFLCLTSSQNSIFTYCDEVITIIMTTVITGINLEWSINKEVLQNTIRNL